MKNALVLLLAVLASCQSNNYPKFEEQTAGLRDEQLAPFYHGVASGDPLTSSVIIWTRVTPEVQLPEIDVIWEVASDPQFQFLVASGNILTGPGRDYTVKVDVTDLQPGDTYYYRFKALGSISKMGKMKTLPLETDQISLAAVSCSNYEFGYFNAYQALSQEEQINAVLHLGDYIYEYGPGRYGDTTLGRTNLPEKEIISLEDYRTRYNQYRLDPDLQAAHQNHPFINIWDDHEVSNNSYQTGAQNHQPNEGDYIERKNNAVQAYYEWIPIRETKPHYRVFKFGGLAELIMLDERLAGRTKPADSLQDPVLNSPEHSMLGEEQLSWFKDQLSSSEATWKIIGNQVIFSYLNWGRPNFKINLDSWDGYPAEQQDLIDHIRGKEINNIIFLTGDTHSSWAFDVTNNPFDDYDRETGEGSIAVELGTTSINSSNSDENSPRDSVIAHEQKITNSELNPHLKFSNLRDHGYLIVQLTDTAATGKWKYVSTLKSKSFEVRDGMKVKIKEGTNKLTGIK